MRPRTRLNEHAATPMPSAAEGRRVLRSRTKKAAGSSSSSGADDGGKAAPQTKRNPRTAPSDDVENADIAPLFREEAERGLEQIRLLVQARKDGLTEKVAHFKKQLYGQSVCSARSLPESVRNMKVKDYNAQYDCDLIEMLKSKALGIFLGLDEGDDDDEMDEACPATIRRGAGRDNHQRTLQSQDSSSMSSAGHADPAGFETPAVVRAKPSNSAFWSTTAKKYVHRSKRKRIGSGGRQPDLVCSESITLTVFVNSNCNRSKTSTTKSGGGDSPDEKILTVSKKRGAILESCGMDLLTLAHDPEMAGTLDGASLENIQKLHQLSSMILRHREKYSQQGIGLLGAVAEEDKDD
jgi:hypothetical protein